MSSARMHLVDNIFQPGTTSYDYVIIPSRVTYIQGTTSVSVGTGWYFYDSGVTVQDKPEAQGGTGGTFTYAKAWGTTVSAGSTDGWVGPLGPLVFIFPNAVVSKSGQGGFGLKVEIIDAWAYGGPPDSNPHSVVLAGIDSDDALGAEPGFWIQSYQVANDNNLYRAAGSATVRLSIVDGFGNEQPGKFLFPFTDIDVNYDGTTDSTEDPRGRYTESVQITSAGSNNDPCDIYAKSGTGGGQGSWLYLESLTGSVDTHVSATDGQTFNYSNVDGYGLRFGNYTTNLDDTSVGGVHTGIVCMLASSSTVIWRGSVCGTSLKGENLSYQLYYDGNPPSISGTVTNVPGQQTKVKGVALTLSSTIPVFNSTQAGVSARFKEWNTARDGSNIGYQPSASYNDDTHNTLHAQWVIGYTISFHTNGGYAIKDTIQGPQSLISFTVDAGRTTNPLSNGWRLERIGYTLKEWNTRADGTGTSYPVNHPFEARGPITYYAIWQIKTYPVVFYDGYSDDVLKTVYVKHGQNVDPNDVPVVGQVYEGREFRNPSRFYSFAGWAGSMHNIVDTTNIVARWDFTPIWVMKNGSWVKYNPTEN